MKNNCTSPIHLRWDYDSNQYKVNKPLDQSGNYVDLSVADQMLFALRSIRDAGNITVDQRRLVTDAIRSATYQNS